jgi:hypothetical protein
MRTNQNLERDRLMSMFSSYTPLERFAVWATCCQFCGYDRVCDGGVCLFCSHDRQLQLTPAECDAMELAYLGGLESLVRKERRFSRRTIESLQSKGLIGPRRVTDKGMALGRVIADRRLESIGV